MSKTKATAKANFEKTPRKNAVTDASKLASMLETICDKVTVVGSIRRCKDMIGDIDIVVIPTKLDEFLTEVKSMIDYEYGGQKKIFGMFNGRPINIFTTTPESYGACVYQTTGPAAYNIHMRRLAKRKGMKINEYGLWDRETNEYIAGSSEESMFEALKMEYKEPENRKVPWQKKTENA